MYKIISILVATFIAFSAFAGSASISQHEANIQKRLKETPEIRELCNQKLEYYEKKVKELEHKVITSEGQDKESAKIKLDYFKRNLYDYKSYCVDSH